MSIQYICNERERTCMCCAHVSGVMYMNIVMWAM